MEGSSVVWCDGVCNNNVILVMNDLWLSMKKEGSGGGSLVSALLLASETRNKNYVSLYYITTDTTKGLTTNQVSSLR